MFRGVILHCGTTTDWTYAVLLVFLLFLYFVTRCIIYHTYEHACILAGGLFTGFMNRQDFKGRSWKKGEPQHSGFWGLHSQHSLLGYKVQDTRAPPPFCYLLLFNQIPKISPLEIIPPHHFSCFRLGRKLNRKHQMAYLDPMVSEVPTGKYPTWTLRSPHGHSLIGLLTCAGSCWRLVHTPTCSLFGGLPKNKEYNTRYESPRKLGRCHTAFRVSLANVSTLSSSHSLVQGSDGLQRCKAWDVMRDVCWASQWSGLHAGPKVCMVECTSAETLPACISTFPRPTASGWMDGRKMEKQSKLCVI